MGTSGKILLGLLGVVVVLGLIGSMGNKQPPTSSKQNIAPNEGTSKSQQDESLSLNNYREDIDLIRPVKSDSLQFSDKNINITFSFVEELDLTLTSSSSATSFKRIVFELKNKAKRAIVVNWNKSSIILPSNISSKVIHEGIRYSAAGQDIPPTTIPPSAKIRDSIVPTRNINISFLTKNWQISGLGLSKGATFSLYLVLEIENEEKPYNFQFRVDSLEKI